MPDLDHRPDADTIDAAAHIAFRAVERFAEEVGACGSCLIVRALVRGCYYSARNARNEQELQHLADALHHALVEGWHDSHGEGAGMEEEAFDVPLSPESFLVPHEGMVH